VLVLAITQRWRRPMKITVVGRGSVGGGLADRWQQTGHRVTRLGRDRGDASDADAVLVAVPSDQIADALGKVDGLEGKIALDATNAYAGRAQGYDSLAHQVKAGTPGRASSRRVDSVFRLARTGRRGDIESAGR
jgi:predicted dinucleotide-binding enzyme